MPPASEGSNTEKPPAAPETNAGQMKRDDSRESTLSKPSSVQRLREKVKDPNEPQVRFWVGEMVLDTSVQFRLPGAPYILHLAKPIGVWHCHWNMSIVCVSDSILNYWMDTGLGLFWGRWSVNSGWMVVLSILDKEQNNHRNWFFMCWTEVQWDYLETKQPGLPKRLHLNRNMS